MFQVKYMQRNYFKQYIIRFRKFRNKGYAAFCSMHKIVNIGCVSRRIADLELLKAGKATILGLLTIPSLLLYAEDTPPDDTLDPTLLQLAEVSVTAERSQFQSEQFRQVANLSADEIQLLPATTIGSLLRYVPGVDMRERGMSGVQSDLSIRGGTGKQVKILLNGVDISDPQTEHYSMDLPVPVGMIERIEVLQGTNYALDAFSGAINIVTTSALSASDTINGASEKNYEVAGAFTAGEYCVIHPFLSCRLGKQKWYMNLGAAYNRSSGYMADTDYKIADAFVQTGYKGLCFQTGLQYKDAGANSFYTVKYPNQYDQTRTLFTSLSYEHTWRGGWNLQGNVYYRGHFDRFHTYREGKDIDGNAAPDWYKGPNLTWTHSSGAHVQGSWNNSWSKMTIGLDVRDELIESSSLGWHNRLNVRYFAEERLYWRSLSLAAGASGMYNTQFGNDWSVGVNVGYEPVRNLKLFLNFNRAIRIPTYTDLYYHTATQQADKNTKAESALQLEMSIGYEYRHFYINASGYYRWGRDIIDWVKESDPAVVIWRSMNHSRVDAAGAETTIGICGYEWLRKMELSYSFTDVSVDAGELLSLYALDYLRHKAVLQIEHKIYKGFGATWCLRFEQRRGEYTAMSGEVEQYKPVLLLDGSVYWINKCLKVSVEARNMTNAQYVDIGGVKQPRHQVGAKVEFKL